MPIRPENCARYLLNRAIEIRSAILEGAGRACEGSRAYPQCRARNGEPPPVTASRVILTVAHLAISRRIAIRRTCAPDVSAVTSDTTPLTTVKPVKAIVGYYHHD
jgi:hypothetical protein